MNAPACPYCGSASELVDGLRIYPHRPDLGRKRFYLCEPCWAYVGCHPETTRPLGRLADGQLRSAKRATHACFDPLWKKKVMSRREAYARLSSAMGIPPSETHIGMFDVNQCKLAIELVHSGALTGEARA